MRGAWLAAMVLGGLASGVAWADDLAERARAEFETGASAYERGDYEAALLHFEASFAASKRPELLFNTSRALEKLGRPGDAAARLRLYLRERPNSEDKGAIAARIEALDQEQQRLEARRKEAAMRAAVPVVAQVRAAPPPPRTPVYKKWWLWTVVGVVAVGAGVGVGLGVALSQPAASGSQFPTVMF